MSRFLSILWRSAKIGIGLIAVFAIAIAGLMSWYYFETKVCLDKSGDEAIATCTSYLKNDPYASEILLHRGLAYQSKGEHDLAIADFSTSLSVNPYDTQAYWARGTSYEKKKEFDRAIDDWTKLIQVDPNDAGGHLRRGNTYAAKQQIAQARADWEATLRLPDVGGAHEAARQNLDKFK